MLRALRPILCRCFVVFSNAGRKKWWARILEAGQELKAAPWKKNSVLICFVYRKTVLFFSCRTNA
jgi:hypothetical protein